MLRNPSSTESLIDPVTERLNRCGLRISVRIERSPVRNAQGEIIAILERTHALAPGGSCSVAGAHLRLVVEQIPLFFWTTDLDLRLTSHWGRTASLARSFPRYPVGQAIYQYLPCQEDNEAPAKQHFLALPGVSSRLEYASRNRIYDLSIGPYRDSQGTIFGCMGMALDMTEGKVRRAERTRRTFALLLLDLDDMKTISERFGHLTGNRALNRLARVMMEQCRATDVAARYDGDEFAILLLDADAERAENVAARIGSCLHLPPDPFPVLVSIGFSVHPADGFSAPELLEAANKRLYQSKKSRTSRERRPEKQQTESART